jgi:hypothetical protein
MDAIIRSSRPRNDYEARIRKERVGNERRDALAQHVKQDEAQRLANSWYAASVLPAGQAPASSPSSAAGAARSAPPPFGTLDSSQLEYASSADAGKLSRRGEISRRAAPSDCSAPPSSLVSKLKYAYDIQGVGGVAQNLSGESRAAPAAARPVAAQPSPADLQQVSEEWRRDAARARQSEAEEHARAVQEERAMVRDTMADALQRLTAQEAVRKAKMQEQLRMLQESERLALTRLQRERELEALEDQRARQYLDIVEERKRAELLAERNLAALREQRVAMVLAKIEQEEEALDDFMSSAVREAARRLLKLHAEDFDRVAPILRDILREPEFCSNVRG